MAKEMSDNNEQRKFSLPSEYLYSEWSDGELGPVSSRNFNATAALLDMLYNEIISLNKRIEELESKTKTDTCQRCGGAKTIAIQCERCG